ncbi:MAG: aminodeoxychorismate synthase component I [Gammaproteobacteria bacterium]
MSVPQVRRLESFPDLLDLHCANPLRYPHLLESVTAPGPQARFDILFAFPGECLELNAAGELSGPSVTVAGADFLTAFDRCFEVYGCVDSQTVPDGLPFHGGWFVYLGYELAGQIEPSVRLPPALSRLPIALAQRFWAAVIRDHEQQCTWLVSARDAADIAAMSVDLQRVADATKTEADSQPPVLQEPWREDEPQRYLAAVDRIREYIVAGDVFQVNLSRIWRGRLRPEITSAALYRGLRRHNPAPFAGLATWRDCAIASSSPERLVRVKQGRIETRPIAGTRPRGVDVAGDRTNSAELLVHPKERAEHVMLIDLERNDLGRVCEAGSIEVNELMILESYSHVHHIVSNIRGRLAHSVTPGGVLRAVFPGGTITGCPKVRCMQIIAELEGVGRGAYTGAFGYVDDNGDMDFNILIRTLVIEGEEIVLRAGAGIVADSVAENELAETRAKALGLLLALEKQPDEGAKTAL